MIKMAIVEDEDVAAENLINCLKRYDESINSHQSFQYIRFKTGNDFLSSKEAIDIIFMDIMLPDITGMEAISRVRKNDSSVIVIFVTNMIKFAIESYKVDALDYILKPISYERVTLKLSRALDIIKQRTGKTIVISNNFQTCKVSSTDILYIEANRHKRIYHLIDKYDKFFQSQAYDHGRLGDIEEELKEYNFVRISSGILVNLEHISKIIKYDLYLKNGECVLVSHSRKHEFQQKFTNWIGRSK